MDKLLFDLVQKAIVINDFYNRLSPITLEDCQRALRYKKKITYFHGRIINVDFSSYPDIDLSEFYVANSKFDFFII